MSCLFDVPEMSFSTNSFYKHLLCDYYGQNKILGTKAGTKFRWDMVPVLMELTI